MFFSPWTRKRRRGGVLKESSQWKSARRSAWAEKTHDLFDPGSDGSLLTENTDHGIAVDNVATESVLGLESHEENGRFGTGNIVNEMLFDAASRAHSRNRP